MEAADAGAASLARPKLRHYIDLPNRLEFSDILEDGIRAALLQFAL
jgi:hypothetical protein